MSLAPPYVDVADGRTVVTSVVRALAVVAAAFLLAAVIGSIATSLAGVEELDATQVSAPLYALLNGLAFVGFLLAAVGFVRLRDEPGLVHVRSPSASTVGWALVGVVAVLLSAVVMDAVVAALSALVESLFGVGVETGQNNIVEQGRANPELFLWMVPVSLLLVGPGEELVFRGVVQGLFRRSFGVVPGIVLASALFGVGHYAAVSSGSAWTYILVAGSLGLVLGVLYEYTENIAVPALAHGLWNAGLFVVNYYTVTAGVPVPG
ncbi:CPBP family intramembrane glutamic endopeptidase [Haloarcula litorea]|uniref:CPBP family intramembrane glutamic endopeptidase n=1 Tax=Haloarcula litorea TaxID=3032579 RepID=UPI0023E8C06F|nr:CPBP family intramembrane glutamic endopeptidase [Halomicroarcula sp. GDY20]